MKELNRIKQLILILNEARDVYYNDNDETMSNHIYDSLYDELCELEKSTNIFFGNSPTQSVGYEVKSKLIKVKHKDKLLSLNKTKSVEDLEKFRKNKNVLLMYKLDGLTVELVYENGKLILAKTRGNGEIGEDVTHNIKTFKNIPLEIPYKKTLRIVGEAIMTYEQFDKINNNITEGDKYKNPRNLASGSIRQLDSKICETRGLLFYAFKINEGLDSHNSKCIQLNNLRKYGFDICKSFIIVPFDKNLQEIINSMESEKNIPIDGLVMTYDEIDYSNNLPTTSHHPHHSIAFKWSDQAESTILLDILVDVGKSGQVSYTALFEPVEIDGTTVKKATLHNYDYIKDLELGIGDEIEVIKANLIIPQVVENNTRSNTYKKALSCPICGNELAHKGVHQYCDNFNCERQVLGRLAHFCSRDAMDITGMSEETIKSIQTIKFEDGKSVLNSVSDIYDLPKNKSVLYTLDRFGKKKVDNICKAIEESKARNLSNIIYGLSIPQVGRTASKKLAESYHSMENLLEEYTFLDIINLVGDSVGNSFYDNFLENENMMMIIDMLRSYGLNMKQPQKETKSNKLEGLNFVATGSVEQFKNRKELQTHIESLGGKIQSGVSSNTNYLINNDCESKSSKNMKANKLGVKIISELEYLSLTEN